MKDGGRVYPQIDRINGLYGNDICFEVTSSDGISLRDYFAAKAMAGLIGEWPQIGGGTMSDIAARSYEMADAMLKERERAE